MQILLTNDDGILAPGINAIYKRLTKLGNVTVVAPTNAQSAMSHSISLSPITVKQIKISGSFQGFSVEGSPADCVKLAVNELMPKIDLVVSGINHGANVGVNISYSGTVAAAMEAAFYNIPSVAISAALEEEMDFNRSVNYGVDVLESLLPLESGDVVNINIPQIKNAKPKGVKVLPQSINGFDDEYVCQTDAVGEKTYQLKGGLHKNENSDTDTTALVSGYVTVTSLHYDMTEYKRTRELKNKLENIVFFGDNNGS